MTVSDFLFPGGARGRIAVLIIAAAVDLLLGDPHWLWHPVQGIGTLITASESFFRFLFSVPWTETKACPGKDAEKDIGTNPAKNTETDSRRASGKSAEKNQGRDSGKGAEKALEKKHAETGSAEDAGRAGRERIAGLCMTAAVTAASVGCTALLLALCSRIHLLLRIFAEGVFCGRLLALRSLGEAGRSVRDPLRRGDLEGARKAVSMIVGRDTEVLDAEGIIKAAVETIAENTSDGITAPLFYMVLLGGLGGIFYKAGNTLDSMTGYKNKRYRYFGTASALLDDALNYLPSRLTALFMILACHLPAPAPDRRNGRAPDAAEALRIWLRDRRKSLSPNSAQTESVCAGALHLSLLGDAWYFGELHRKEEIGDGLRPVETEDITRAIRLMNGTSALMYAASIFILLLIH